MFNYNTFFHHKFTTALCLYSYDSKIHLDLLRRRSSPRNLLFWLLFAVPGVLCWIHAYETSQKFDHIAVEQHQRLLRSCRTIAFVVDCEQVLWKWSFKIETTEPCEMSMASTISNAFNFQPTDTISWVFSTVSGVETSTGGPERSTSSVLVRPRRNLEHYFLTIEIDGAECL